MKKYVIVKIGKRYVLKEKIREGFFGIGLFNSKSLEDALVQAMIDFFNL